MSSSREEYILFPAFSYQQTDLAADTAALARSFGLEELP